jgi:hypothetical protein
MAPHVFAIAWIMRKMVTRVDCLDVEWILRKVALKADYSCDIFAVGRTPKRNKARSTSLVFLIITREIFEKNSKYDGGKEFEDNYDNIFNYKFIRNPKL